MITFHPLSQTMVVCPNKNAWKGAVSTKSDWLVGTPMMWGSWSVASQEWNYHGISLAAFIAVCPWAHQVNPLTYTNRPPLSTNQKVKNAIYQTASEAYSKMFPGFPV